MKYEVLEASRSFALRPSSFNLQPSSFRPMRTADFDFDLPPELIAQTPAPERDQSRLLILHRDSQRLEHRRFPDLLEHVRAGDVVVLNDSRVIPARLRGAYARSRGQFEILL